MGLPGWAWENPPVPPIACETCGSGPGQRCTAMSGPPKPTLKVHPLRAARVKVWFDTQDEQNEKVVDLGLERARRARHRAKITTPPPR